MGGGPVGRDELFLASELIEFLSPFGAPAETLGGALFCVSKKVVESGNKWPELWHFIGVWQVLRPQRTGWRTRFLPPRQPGCRTVPPRTALKPRRCLT